MDTLAEWFGLKEGHKDFFIANDSDSGLLFARQELDSQLQRILRKSFRTENPPKFVLYGDWGVGKTHTMHHISYEIDHSGAYKARIVFVELPDINSRDTFQVAHAALLDALGLTTVKNWMVQFQTKHQAEALPIIQRATQSEDVAKAFLTLSGYGDTARTSWDWLRGVALNPAEAKNAGLPTYLEQSNQFAAVLRMLGRLSKEIDGEILILMLDEATKLLSVTNGDAINHWLNSFKILSDDLTKEIGLIISASFRDPDDMPPMLADLQIRSRFGEQHYIQLQNFGPEETNDFVRALLSQWTEPEKRTALISEFSAEAAGEDVGDESFPFTEPALGHFLEYALRNGHTATPRDIQKSLDFVVNGAVDDERHLISSDYISGVLAAA